MVRKIGKYIFNGFCFVSGVVCLWVLASWIDIVLHNLEPNSTYQSWNLFVILMKGVL